MKKLLFVVAVFCAFLLLSSCAPGQSTVKSYGFFYGLIHGFIFPFALIGKLFNSSHGIHAMHNTGFFYWLGFIIGLGGIGGGAFGWSKKK